MIRLDLALGLLCATALPSVASTINTGNVSNSTGTVDTYNLGAFSTNSAQQAGLIVQVTWWDNSSAQCTWISAGTCTGSNFLVSEADGANGTYDGTWNFTNRKVVSSLKSVTFLGSGPGNLGGNVAFNMCWTGSAVSTTNTGCVANSGTPGSNLGWTAATLAGGNASSPSSVLYTNMIKLPSNAGAPVGDEFGTVIFNFANGNFASSPTAFTWRMDSDTVSLATPEPATLGMVGLALVALSFVRLRTRRRP